MIKPVPGSGTTAWSRAMKVVTTIGLLPDIDHPAADYPITQNADPMVIERIPFAKAVRFPKGDQFFRQRDAFIHFDRQKRRKSVRRENGNRDDATGVSK